VLVRRASLHLGELVNCRWVEEVTQQLDTLQLQSPGRTVDAAHKDVLVDVLVSFLSRCMECRHGLATRILSVCLSNACIVTKRKKDLSRILYHTKDHLA